MHMHIHIVHIISIHECPDVHNGTSNSRPDMDEHQLLHDCFMPDMYKDEYLKNTKFWT
jgi:hypothetical protein